MPYLKKAKIYVLRYVLRNIIRIMFAAYSTKETDG